MMGRREGGQGQFFYAFDLDKVVPADHLVRQIDGVIDLIANKTKLVTCAAGSLNICCRFFEHLLCELLHTRLGARRYNALVSLFPFKGRA
jgi:hypothetical protein